MDIRDYEYIVTIAEQKSITRAAAQLFITQSALTKFLQRTERSLGVALFFKKGNQFLLTEAGQKYVETGRVIMQLDRQLSNQLESEAAIQRHRIRLGYGMGRSNQLIEEIFPKFFEKYPDVQVSTKAETSRRQMMELQNGTLDMAIVTNVEKVPGYTYLPIEVSRLVLVTAQDSDILKEARVQEKFPFPVISIQRLEGVPMVMMPATTNSGNLARELFKSQNVESKIVLEVSDIRSLLDAVENGLGVAVCMNVPLGKHKLQYLNLEEVEPIEQVTTLVYRSDKALNEAMRYFIQLLTEQKEDLK